MLLGSFGDKLFFLDYAHSHIETGLYIYILIWPVTSQLT